MGEGAGSDTSTIRVQKQAARRLLNALPDVVRIAYGWLIRTSGSHRCFLGRRSRGHQR